MKATMPEYEVSFCCLHCRSEISGTAREDLDPTKKYCDCISAESLTTRMSRLRREAESKNRSAKALA